MNLTVAVALATALGSAATFGISTSLQHQAAGVVRTGRGPLIWHLVRNRVWLAGTLFSLAAFTLHAVALGLGSLGLVQPVIVTGIVFAVLIRAGLDRRMPSRAELLGVGVTWLGLAAFLLGTGAGAHPGSTVAHHAGTVALVLGCAGGVLLAASTRATTPTTRGLWLGATSGVLFGLVASLLKLVIDHAHGPASVVTSWPLWALTLAGASAIIVNQKAFEATRLSISMPLLNIVDVLAALLFAAVVFGEVPSTAPASLVLSGLGLAGMITGVVWLSRREEELEAELVEALVG